MNQYINLAAIETQKNIRLKNPSSVLAVQTDCDEQSREVDAQLLVLGGEAVAVEQDVEDVDVGGPAQQPNIHHERWQHRHRQELVLLKWTNKRTIAAAFGICVVSVHF